MSKAADGWRDRILRELGPPPLRLTVAVDPDGLILDEAVLAALRQRSVDVLVFEESVAFRYAYESRCRPHLEEGKAVDVVVVSRQDGYDADLPYDVLQSGRQCVFGLDKLFPRLSRTVVAGLGSSHLHALYEAVEREPPEVVLGDGKSRDFVLRHVFQVMTELIVEPPDLLRALLRIHHSGQSLPPLLGEHFVGVLQDKGRFAEWPLEEIVPDQDIFFEFLEERWPLFLDGVSGSLGTPVVPGHELAYPGPAALPFDHDDVRIYIDNLFLEGFLQPVLRQDAKAFAGSWIAAGVRIKGDATDATRLGRLVDLAAESVPDREARYDEWLRFARMWAEAGALRMALEIGAGSPDSEADPAHETEAKLATLHARVDDSFAAWLDKRYAGLASLPPVSPVMLHHVPSLLARHLAGGPARKAALLVVDGLAMDQWITVREELARRSSNYRFREGAVFAWIPTLTTVSRQAAFAGMAPFYFPANSIHSTNREPALWRQLWAGHGLTSHAVVYQKKLGRGSLDAVEDLISRPAVRVAGLVVDTVDEIMHGMKLGSAGMHGQVRQWARESYLARLLDLLFENGFRVWLTSDHGNVEATGCGMPTASAVSDIRGKRVHIYESTALRQRAAKEFPDARRWAPWGLPEDYLALLAPGRTAFVREGEQVVAHGGASLEEVVVPLVRIDRANP